MKKFNTLISREENRLQNLLSTIFKVINEEENIKKSMSEEIKKLRKEKLESNSYSEKNNIEAKIEKIYSKYSTYCFHDIKILRAPYFGVIDLEDDKFGALSYKIGKNTIFGESGKVEVIDWREAPVSRLFYEYDSGESYDEDIRDIERTGIIKSKTKLGISKKVLLSISEGQTNLIKNKDGNWTESKFSRTMEKKEQKKNHNLPEITALLDKEQFQSITLNPNSTFILQGGAGSGKTTVGLHRIAYLTYKSRIFTPKKIMVIMYNKSLMQYIKGVLPELGVNRVKTETFHSFAKSASMASGSIFSYRSQNQPEYITKLKKSSFTVSLIQTYIENLFKKSKSWLLQKIKNDNSEEIQALISTIKKQKNL